MDVSLKIGQEDLGMSMTMTSKTLTSNIITDIVNSKLYHSDISICFHNFYSDNDVIPRQLDTMISCEFIAHINHLDEIFRLSRTKNILIRGNNPTRLENKASRNLDRVWCATGSNGISSSSD